MFSRLKLWISKKCVYRQTYKELMALSDHELADLGLSRGDIEPLAYEAAYGKEYRYV